MQSNGISTSDYFDYDPNNTDYTDANTDYTDAHGCLAEDFLTPTPI